MSDRVELNTFPASRVEALALEYAKLKYTDQMTAKEFAKEYLIAAREIKDLFAEVRRGAPI